MEIYRFIEGMDRIPVDDLLYILKRAKDGKRIPGKYRKLFEDTLVRFDIRDSGLARITRNCETQNFDLELTDLGRRVAIYDRVENMPKDLQERLRRPKPPKLSFPTEFARRVSELYKPR